MNNTHLIEILSKLPPGTEVFVRGGAGASDDAWTPSVRVFEYNGKLSAYICMAVEHEHRNFPEHYSGVKEVTREILGGGT